MQICLMMIACKILTVNLVNNSSLLGSLGIVFRHNCIVGVKRKTSPSTASEGSSLPGDFVFML